MNTLRNQAPVQFGDIKVCKVEDFQEQTVKTQSGEDTINLPKANVLKYTLADGSWIAARPSGTEPKIKFYFEVAGKLTNRTEFDAVEKQSDARIDAMMKELDL